jgi:hypothetical protein
MRNSPVKCAPTPDFVDPNVLDLTKFSRVRIAQKQKI